MAMQVAYNRHQAFRWPAETQQQVWWGSPAKIFPSQSPPPHSNSSYVPMAPIDQRRAWAATFMEERGFEVVHQNGQRISTNLFIDQNLIKPSDFSEVFLGKLPRDMFEDELFPHLLQLECNIVKIRYMMDFSGTNRGFCFVKFASIHEAIVAAIHLDGKTLRSDSDTPIGAQISFDNKCLYFGNLPPNCTAQQLRSALRRAEVEGVVKVEMASRSNFQTLNLPEPLFPYSNTLMPTPQVGFYRPPQQHQSYCYVHFDTHVSATKARRLLMPGEVRLLGRNITIDWAKSEYPPEVQDLVDRAALKKRQLMQLANQQQIVSFPQNPAQGNIFFHSWNY